MAGFQGLSGLTYGTSSGDYVVAAPTTHTTSTSFTNLIDAEMKKTVQKLKDDLNKQLYGDDCIIKDHYIKKIEENVFSSSPLMNHLTTKENKKMNDTEAAVAKARAERKEEQAKDLLAHIEAEIGQYEITAGTFITARVVFPDSDKVYRYAWIKGDRLWYRTKSMAEYSTANLVDELVRLILDAVEVEWEIVGQESA